MQRLHFSTTNNAQAFSLCLAGFEPIEIRNEYTPDQLDALGCGAREAWKVRGISGTVTYVFEPTDELLACAAAYDDEIARLKRQGEGSTLPAVMPEDVVRITAACLTQRKPFADLWKRVTPHLTVQKPGAPQRIEGANGEFRIIYPGFISISINASKEDLARLGV